MKKWLQLVEDIFEGKEVEVPQEFLNYLQRILLFRMEILERRRNPFLIDYSREREIFKKYAALDEDKITEITREIARKTQELDTIRSMIEKIQEIKEKGVKAS
ncbi:MAG: hypothetical protein ACPL3E_02920 [Minisyncoccia bacterium]